MGLFDKIKEPVFLKEGHSLKNQLSELERLHEIATGDLKTEIEKAIYAVKAGISGEDQIIYELKNSHMPMYVIHDWNITFGDNKAQIDFLVVTRGKTFVIECKNLWGNITVDNKGQFIRTVSYGKYSAKEAMYSPIEQNRKHLDLIKEISLSRRNAIGKMQVNRWFDNWYQGVVVMANPKTIVNDRYAPKAVKEQLIRADGLTEYIKKVNSDPIVLIQSEKDFTEFANKLLSLNIEDDTDYNAKFRRKLEIQNTISEDAETSKAGNDVGERVPVCPRCGGKLVRRIAKRGDNVGNTFYGCEKFPKCRGIMSEEQYTKQAKTA